MIRVKKKKKNKEREALSLKRKCAECGEAISEDAAEKVYKKEHGQTFYFCSMDCYVVWEMRK